MRLTSGTNVRVMARLDTPGTWPGATCGTCLAGWPPGGPRIKGSLRTAARVGRGNAQPAYSRPWPSEPEFGAEQRSGTERAAARTPPRMSCAAVIVG